MEALILCVCLVTLAVGTYAIWPSKWNIPAHMQLGFCLTAYVVPVFFAHTLNTFNPALISAYTAILLVGTIGYVAGLYIGTLGKVRRATKLLPSFASLPAPLFHHYVNKRTVTMLAGALVTLAICFAVMGFVPAFAADPFLAKFFRGPYQEPYLRVAIPYRLAYNVITTLMPVAFGLWIVKRKPSLTFLCLACVAAMSVCLTRGPVAEGALLALGVIATRKRSWFITYLMLMVVIFPIGAIIYKLIGFTVYYRQNLWQTIASGSPDISDQLHFLSAFMARNSFTHGKTFFGGLVPGRYKWNPSVYSLLVETGSKTVNDIASGGLRLPAPLWGYTAFGIPGALLVPLVSGVIMGRWTKIAEVYTTGAEPLQAIIMLTLYNVIGTTFAQFYILAYGSVPAIATVVTIGYLVAPSSNLRRFLRSTCSSTPAPLEIAYIPRSPDPKW